MKLTSLPLEVLGIGRYLPSRVVTNNDVEVLAGMAPGTVDRSAAGVSCRRWVDDGEEASVMGAKAAREALRDAGVADTELDLIINASGTQERVIPDGAALLQHAMGLAESGIPCFSVHGTCLSFLHALSVAGAFFQAGLYRRILIVASDICSRHISPSDAKTFSLFGDMAAAAVVGKSGEASGKGISAVHFETYSEGALYTRVDIGTRTRLTSSVIDAEQLYFKMDGRRVFLLASRKADAFLEKIRPGLSSGLGALSWVVPHQASGMAMDGYVSKGWPRSQVISTLDKYGNTNAASIPGAFYEAVKDGRIQRGQEVLFIGTGAGLSLGGVILRF